MINHRNRKWWYLKKIVEENLHESSNSTVQEGSWTTMGTQT